MKAPFIPFFTEYLYQGLKSYLEPSAVGDASNFDSIHYLLLPEAQYYIYVRLVFIYSINFVSYLQTYFMYSCSFIINLI